MADQEWVVVKSRVERELATALAKLAGENDRSVSYLIRGILLGNPAVQAVLRGR